MSEYRGDSDVMGPDPYFPSLSYKPFFKMIYVSVLAQASLSYIFFSLGVLFSPNPLGKRIIGLYALIFGVVSLLYHLSIQSVIDRVHLFFPKFEEDIVKHTFYFLIGIPGIDNPESFQLSLASTLFSIVGLVGTFISFRHQNLLSSYFSQDLFPYNGF